MRHALWSFGAFGLGLGGLAIVGGTVVGGDLGPLAVGYGVLTGLCALYLVAGLAIRERAWRRLGRSVASTPRVDRLAGRRVF